MMNTWRYRDDILDALPTPLLVLDRMTLAIQYANQAAETYTACPSEVLAGYTLLDFFLPPERERLAQAMFPLQEGQVRRLREAFCVGDGKTCGTDIFVHATRLHDEPCLVVQLRTLDELERIHSTENGTGWRRDALLQGVANATNRLMQPGSYERTAGEALEIIGKASDTDCVGVFQIESLPDEHETLFLRKKHWMRPGTESRQASFPKQIAVHQHNLDGLYARLERYEMISGTPETLPELCEGLFGQYPVQSLIIAPIFIDVSLWGFIGLCDLYGRRVWSHEEASALQTLAASIGAAKQREQFEQKLRHERAVADTLREVGTVLTSTLDLDEMLARLLNQARRIVPFDSANVMLIHDDTARIVHCIGQDTYGTPLEQVCSVEFPLAQASYIRYLVMHRTPLVVPDVSQSPLWKETPGAQHVRSWLGMPFLMHGEVVGLFALDSVTPHFYSDEHVRMLLPFAQQAGIAFENVRLYEKQRAQAGSWRRGWTSSTRCTPPASRFSRLLSWT